MSAILNQVRHSREGGNPELVAEQTTLGAICEKPEYGWTTKANHEGGSIHLLRTSDITPGVIDWETVPYCTECPENVERYLVRDGDILISRAGSVGVSNLVSSPAKAVFASYLIRFRPKTGVNPRYVAYFLKSPAYWRQISEKQSGIALLNVNAKKLAQIELPLPHRDIQDRIVAELETQLTRLDASVTALKRVQANLKRYRASVLKAACEGMIGSIRQELNSWREIRIGDVCELENGDRSKTYPSKRDFVDSGVPFINAGHLENGAVQFGEMNYISESKFQALRAGKVRNADVLFCLRGSLGKVAIVQDVDRAAIASSLIILRCGTDITPKYLLYFLSSPQARLEISRYDNGSAQPNLAGRDLEKFSLRLPSLKIQMEIVAEVERRLSVIEELEATVAVNLKRAERLRQSVLARAFRA